MSWQKLCKSIWWGFYDYFICTFDGMICTYISVLCVLWEIFSHEMYSSHPHPHTRSCITRYTIIIIILDSEQHKSIKKPYFPFGLICCFALTVAATTRTHIVHPCIHRVCDARFASSHSRIADESESSVLRAHSFSIQLQESGISFCECLWPEKLTAHHQHQPIATAVMYNHKLQSH